LTSANLSKAAWGTLQKNNSQFQMRNFEVGVLFLSSKISPGVRFTAGSAPFKYCEESISFPVPSKIPPTPYSIKDSAWVWDVAHEKPDIFGVTYNA